jgi:hypothetical protein
MNAVVRIFLSLLALNLHAEDPDEDIFADIDNRMEVDADFEDDFADIEKTKFSNSSRVVSNTNFYTNFSERSWVRKEKSLGGLVSQETIARVFYMTVFPQLRFKTSEFFGHMGLPLKFPIYDNISANSGKRSRGFVDVESLITPRPNDYRSFADAFKIIRRLEFSKPNKDYYVSVGREQKLSLGQGDLMREMVADYIYDQDYLFAQAHAHFEPVEVSAFVGPIPKAHMAGANLSVKPLWLLDAHNFVKNLSLDLAYVADYRAPHETHRQENAFILDHEKRLIKRTEGTAHGLSLGVAGLYEPITWFSSKPFVALGNLWLTNVKINEQARGARYGLGLSLGHEAYFNFTSQKTSQLMFRSEARFFSENYQPNYFGDNYMLDRLRIFENDAVVTSKAQFVGHRENTPWRFGHMFELGYFYEDIFNTKISYENARTLHTNIPIIPMRKLRFSTGVLAFDRVSLHAGFEAHSIDNLKDLFNFEKSRGMLSLQGQVKILSFLYFDSWLKHSFGVNNSYEAKENREWLSQHAETKSLNFGIGLELAMTF